MSFFGMEVGNDHLVFFACLFLGGGELVDVKHECVF